MDTIRVPCFIVDNLHKTIAPEVDTLSVPVDTDVVAFRSLVAEYLEVPHLRVRLWKVNFHHFVSFHSTHLTKNSSPSLP